MQQISLTLELNQKTIDALQVLHDTLNGESAPKEPAPAKTSKPRTSKPKTDPLADAPEPDPVPDKEDKEEAVVTMTDVRAEALKLSKAGQQAVLKEIFAKYDNATKLSDISEENYPALMEDLRTANG